MMKILAIVPAYNEEQSVSDVVIKIKLYMPEADILVINDGSIDATSERATDAGAKVINVPFNLGIGGAMQTGYLYAKRNNYDIAVQVDADGQHDPAYIKDLIKPIMLNKADMVIGSRFIEETSYRPSVFRKIGIKFFSALVRFLSNRNIADPTSGFRAVNREIIKYFSEYYPVDYPEVDVLIKLFRKGYRIIEIPVEMEERKKGRSSITPLRSVYYMIKVTLCLFMESLKNV